MRFRLVWYDTDMDDKYLAEDYRFEYFGNREAIWYLWYLLKDKGCRHINVYSLDGTKQEPEKGRDGMIDYSL